MKGYSSWVLGSQLGGVFLTPTRVIAAQIRAWNVTSIALLFMCDMTRAWPSYFRYNRFSNISVILEFQSGKFPIQMMKAVMVSGFFFFNMTEKVPLSPWIFCVSLIEDPWQILDVEIINLLIKVNTLNWPNWSLYARGLICAFLLKIVSAFLLQSSTEYIQLLFNSCSTREMSSADSSLHRQWMQK